MYFKYKYVLHLQRTLNIKIMMQSRTKGLLFMAATMAAMGESFNYANQETHRFAKKSRKRRLLPKTVLTAKQQKSRSKEKRAKIARKLNRL